MQYILLTGASSGIGYEMAQQLAQKGHNLILVARNETKLAQLKTELASRHGVTVEHLKKDLSNVQSAIELYEWVQSKGWVVTALVNNAGVGNYGKFTETDLREDLKMVELNVMSLVALTKLFAKDMVLRKSGKIMNIASLLSFLPFPYYAVYSATKSFVLSFTETIAAELEGTGVTVTALCPGPVDTAFQTAAMKKTNAMSANKPVSPGIIAAEGVALLLHGKGKKIPGFGNWVLSNLPRITPDFIMMKIKKHLASPRLVVWLLSLMSIQLFSQTTPVGPTQKESNVEPVAMKSGFDKHF